MSPMQRSLKKLRDEGYHCEITEHFSRGLKHDLWGFCDILAIKENEVLAVQTTSAANKSARIKKITESEKIAYVRKAGIRVVVHAWGLKKKTGKWESNEEDLS